MLVTDYTDRTPKPEVIDFVARLDELHARITGAVAALNEQDAKLPMLASVTADLAAAHENYATIYSRELEAATRYAAMVAADEQRAADYESAVRLALEEGRTPPTGADADLVEKILTESKQARMDAWPLVESAAADYIAVAKRAAGSRALLLVSRLRPIVEAYQPTITALREAEGRVDPVRSTFTEAAMVEQFRVEGILQGETP